ncbi:MAG: hypothetical protein CMB18_04460 [Euryarchaeota archaeon]|nr:hypothetical protein [Euryarchaeota archaeon]|tara:strand:- start:1807 stop:3636 length:1830 start_codon:yes stop_codon:yes gene_type:complete
MSARFEAVALKKLQEIIQEKGISAEAIFSKFDINNDGSLDPQEFSLAIASITGQNAPDAIIRAVFSALDNDGDNTLDLAEILTLAGGGQAGAVTVETNEITIQGHTIPEYNGGYLRGDDINGNPSFSKPSGHTLYFYNMSAGGAKSWSLHKRRTDGSKDLYDGGWTRPPSSGGVPLGTRRWVGVGMLTITAVGDRTTPNAKEAENEETTDIRIELQKGTYKSNELISVNFTGPLLGADSWMGIVPADTEHGDSTANRYNRVSYLDMEGQSIGTHSFENPGEGNWTIRMNNDDGEEIAYVEFKVEAVVEEIVPVILETNTSEKQATSPSSDGLNSVDKMMSDMGPEFVNDLENILSNPNQSIDEARAAADEIAEQKISELPFLFQSPARRMWSKNADSILANIVENLPPAEDLAKAAAVASAVGVGAAAVATQAGLEGQTPQDAVVDAVVNTVIDQAAGVMMDSVVPIEEVSVTDTETQVEQESISVPEPAAVTEPDAETIGLDLVSVASALSESRFLNDQVEIVESTKGLTTIASVRVEKIERTFSIGIEDEYRGGQTIIGSVEGVGDVEIHLKPSMDLSDIGINQSSNLTLSLHKWNGIRKRLELYAQ